MKVIYKRWQGCRTNPERKIMKTEKKERKVLLAEQYADKLFPIIDDYYRWKYAKTLFLDGWDACEQEYLKNLKEVIDANN